jgi:ABC-type multidrug transport system fused ATPase/permease subunit
MIKKIISFFLLLRKLKIKLFKQFILIFIATIFETISIISLLPLILTLTNEDFSQIPILVNIMNLSGSNSSNLTLHISIFLLFIFILKFVYLNYYNYQQGKFVYGTEKTLSLEILKKYLLQNIDIIEKKNSSAIINMITSQAYRWADFGIKSTINLTSDIFMVIGLLIFLFFLNPLLLLFSVIFIIISSYSVNSFVKNINYNWGNQNIDLEQKRLTSLREIFSFLRNIKLHNLSKFYVDEFEYLTFKSRLIIAKQHALNNLPRLFIELLAVLVFMISLIFSNYFFINTGIGVIASFAIIGASAFRIIPALGRIQGSIINIQFALPILDEIKELMKIKENPINNFMNENLDFKNNFQLKNIKFSYENKKIFNNLNLLIEKNKITGIIGPSGSGKTSLLNIIAGFNSPSSGDIFLDGKKIEVSSLSWKNLIGYVPQDVFIFNRSVIENIATGEKKNHINKKFLERSIKLSNLESFINELNFKEEEILGEDAYNISGGQAQRIAIARSLYRNPKILLFDESTNSLDIKAESQILKELQKLKEEITIVIITHRENTLKFCDKVYNIEDLDD